MELTRDFEDQVAYWAQVTGDTAVIDGAARPVDEGVVGRLNRGDLLWNVVEHGEYRALWGSPSQVRSDANYRDVRRDSAEEDVGAELPRNTSRVPIWPSGGIVGSREVPYDGPSLIAGLAGTLDAKGEAH